MGHTGRKGKEGSGCASGCFSTTSVSTGRRARRCLRASIASASAATPSSSSAGLVHRAGSLFDESKFDGDENAIVDFKYSTSPRITWWFDHHQSAFLTPGRRRPLRAAAVQHQVLRSRLQELHQVPGHGGGAALRLPPGAGGGADRVGGHHRRGAVPDARSAVEMREPAMRLTMIIEASQDPGFMPRLIPLLAYQSAGRECWRSRSCRR